ncbi:hypothetical protein FBU30_005645 [Linnemannia zychae]|nr:hypothetical protein FBU30_005645 [Linnemannia zychae]
MSSAAPIFARSLEIPELSSMIASYLEKREITNLMMTCRSIKQAMGPSFYRNVCIHYRDLLPDLWKSSSAQKALAENVKYVRTLNCRFAFILCYYDSVLAFDSSKDNCTISEAVSLKSILLRNSFSVSQESPEISSHLERVLIEDIRQGQLLSSMLLDLKSLKDLDIGLSFYDNGTEAFLPLFFSIQTSLKCSKICVCLINKEPTEKLFQQDDNTAYLDSKPEISNRISIAEWKRREGPLVNLKCLVIHNSMTGSTTIDYLKLIKDCPSLEKMEIRGGNQSQLSGITMHEICPNLNDVSYSQEFKSQDGVSWPLDITRVLPNNHLKGFHYNEQLSTRLDPALMEATLLRHSCSLQYVCIHSSITSIAQKKLLQECESLRVFRITGAYIDLTDHRIYSRYRQIPHANLSDEENDIFARLGKLYHQIGKQSNLESLHLEQTDAEGKVQTRFGGMTEPMPGMLRLNSSHHYQPGFLDVFSGLSKLRELTGIGMAETQNGLISPDSEEFKWMNEHWPKKKLYLCNGSYRVVDFVSNEEVF